MDDLHERVGNLTELTTKLNLLAYLVGALGSPDWANTCREAVRVIKRLEHEAAMSRLIHGHRSTMTGDQVTQEYAAENPNTTERTP